jgi:hypothetical protein
VSAWGNPNRPPQPWLVGFLLQDARFLKRASKLRFERLGKVVAAMAPAPRSAGAWHVPQLPTRIDLASWLGISLDELFARADCRGREAQTPPGPLRNYFYSWQGKRSGAARLIESPKPRLRSLQQKILHGILDAIPPHEAAHGFRRGRSVATFTAPHVGKRLVLRMDLRDFFASIRGSRAHAIFYTAGYPPPVAQLLAALCWNMAPDDVWLEYPGTLPCDLGRLPAARHYRDRHLPQGAPTSPALANLSAYRLDRRLTGLAASAGAAYTRFADDLLFSGDDVFARNAKRFSSHVAAIAQEEGFTVHHRKTRFMRQGVRQIATGIVLNDRANTLRRDYEMLRATLHRCRRDGPTVPDGMSPEYFRSQLSGKIAWIGSVNARRGERLRMMFNGIDWTTDVR